MKAIMKMLATAIQNFARLQYLPRHNVSLWWMALDGVDLVALNSLVLSGTPVQLFLLSLSFV